MRILVEHENPRVVITIARDLEAAGHTVLACSGPGGRNENECPLLAGGPCDLVEQADVVLAGLPLEKARIYAALRDRYQQPIVLLLSDAERARLPLLEELGPWLSRGLRGSALAVALERVVGEVPGHGAR